MNQVYEKDSWLYWNINKNYNALKDSLAGHLDNTKGYYKVKINLKAYYNHRILYQFYHNVILNETDIVDHIDGNPINNKKENLRLATKQQNCMNRKVNKNNKSTKIKNICIMHRDGYDEYRIQIRKHGKKVFSKCFRTNKFTLDEVVKIRDEQLLKHHEEFISTGEHNI